jgi:two-component system chemotaxis response regulator CheB
MSQIRVFVVDDSQLMRTILSRILEASPACELVGSSHDAENARAAIAELKPDVVTLDICMPGIDGVRYLDELRANAHPAIVVVSASTTPGSVSAERVMQHGADAYFDKARIVSDADLLVEMLCSAARAGASTRH